MNSFLTLPASGIFPLSDLPRISMDTFRDGVVGAALRGARIACLAVLPDTKKNLLCAVLAHDARGMIEIAACEVGREYPALTPSLPQAHLFEREIAEQYGIQPVGHPWMKPVRFAAAECGVMDYFTVHGEEVHEVAVGPVHAGIIEPCHFRFQCHGENIFHLEISLGYQHRGVERACLGGPDPRTIHYMETCAGDTTIGHAMAYSRLAESLGHVHVPARAHALRGVAAELERIANHVGDLGALAGDIGFLPTQSYCGRLRGDFLNMTAELCGNRFGRGLVRPGGVAYDLSAEQIEKLLTRLDAAACDVESAVNLLWNEPSVLARFEGVGTLSADTCHELGLVGVAARASGVDIDVRRDFPYGMYRFSQLPVTTWLSGDVFARALVRWQEVQRSLAFVYEQLEVIPAGSLCVAPGEFAKCHVAVKLVEGWRGEICHVALTDDNGKFARYKIVDASFHNWFGLAYAMRNQQISDFPMCNKSFNLSYCGFDL